MGALYGSDQPLLYPIKQTYPAGLATPLEMINRYFLRLYEESLSEPEYVLLCRKEYEALLAETTRIFRFVNRVLSREEIEADFERTKQPDPWIKLANTATGKFAFVSTLPDMPRCKEFSRAHLAFEQWQHTRLPELQPGEIIALCPSSEEYLKKRYGR